MTAAQQLALLPRAAQDQLWPVVQIIADMDAEEKRAALIGMNDLVSSLLIRVATGGREHVAGAQLLAAVGELICEMHHQANPDERETVR